MNTYAGRRRLTTKGTDVFLWFKTRGRCFYCKRQIISEKMIGISGIADKVNVMVREHFFPRAKGGRNDHSNLVPACRQCDKQKKDMIPDTFPESLIPKWFKNAPRFSAPRHWK